MANINLNPSGASGNLSNIASAMMSTIQIGDPVARATQMKLQDESLFAQKGLFSPIGVVKNVLGNVSDEKIKEWRTHALQDIDKLPPAIAYTLFGDMYAHLLDYDARQLAMRVSAATSGAQEEKEAEKYFAEQRKQGGEDIRKRIGVPEGLIPEKKKLLGIESKEQEQAYNNYAASFKNLTGTKLIDSKADRIKNTIFVNYDRLAELVNERDKTKDAGKKSELNMEIDRLLKMTRVQKELLQRSAKKSYISGNTGEFLKSQRDLLGGMDVMEDYIMKGYEYRPEEMNQVVVELVDRAKAVGEENIKNNYDKIINEYGTASSGAEAIFRSIGQFGFGGLVQGTGADVLGSKPSKWLEGRVVSALTDSMMSRDSRVKTSPVPQPVDYSDIFGTPTYTPTIEKP